LRVEEGKSAPAGGARAMVLWVPPARCRLALLLLVLELAEEGLRALQTARRPQQQARQG
jgi:hypothetical protein